MNTRITKKKNETILSRRNETRDDKNVQWYMIIALTLVFGLSSVRFGFPTIGSFLQSHGIRCRIFVIWTCKIQIKIYIQMPNRTRTHTHIQRRTHTFFFFICILFLPLCTFFFTFWQIFYKCKMLCMYVSYM